MLKVGDRIEVIKHINEKYEWEFGEVILIYSGIKGASQPVVDTLPEFGVEKRYSIKLDNGIELHDLRERQLRKAKADEAAPDFSNFITQLSGVRIGQGDYGRVSNVSGTILECVLKEQWLELSSYQRDALVSENAPILLEIYEGYLRREYKTKEAATLAVSEEYKRLKRKYASLE